uniref:Uncharacterized protein n=1 Tax=Anguilla anguilla TaxID=7936 RepID=A0A0E9V927_ANGAN
MGEFESYVKTFLRSLLVSCCIMTIYALYPLPSKRSKVILKNYV